MLKSMCAVVLLGGLLSMGTVSTQSEKQKASQVVALDDWESPIVSWIRGLLGF